MDKKKKQIALCEPAAPSTGTRPDGEECKPSVSAPKMFAFEALFSMDDPQVEVCNNALIDAIHAVINGNDGCIFCFGNSEIGKTKTMIGSSDSSATAGVIPCAISWLYKAVNEQRQKTGARFSVRVSSVEIIPMCQQFKDLLTDYAFDNEQSPEAFLKNDPILGSDLQNRSELRAPLPEKAAFYLDAALSERSQNEDSHFLYTLHVYQYNVANKGAVAGGRSRLCLIDMASSDRAKGTNSMSISNLGNVLLAIFNGQKHLPFREHKITQVLKECLGSLTCQATLIAHVSPLEHHYHETLAIVQCASRVHRIRRRKIKFTGVSNGINTSIDENGRLTSSSDVDPSSSEQSADTVIYVGPSEETDGEHPPVCIPSLNSADNRGQLSKVLRESGLDHLSSSKIPTLSRSVPASPQKTFKKESKSAASAKKHHLKPSAFHSAHSSPVRTIGRAPDTQAGKLLEELWIDGPRISKSKIAEARSVHLMRKESQKVHRKQETWVDGPMQMNGLEVVYGFMDRSKKSMIRKWVENQSYQLQSSLKNTEKKKTSYKALTVFKTCGDDELDVEEGRGQGSGQEDESEQKLVSCNRRGHDTDMHAGYSNTKMVECTIVDNYDEDMQKSSDDDVEIEIIEVEEPEEPVPTQDSCLQVTEEDIALCMGELENPLPEVDQEDHPLRVLSQENLTIVSSLSGSISGINELDSFPRSRLCTNITQSRRPITSTFGDTNFNDDKDKTRSQLFRLHEMYENKFDLNSCFSQHSNVGDTVRAVSRSQSITLSELRNRGESNLHRNDLENGSIASEPAYETNDNHEDRLCENCRISLRSIHEHPSPSKFWSSYREDSSVASKLKSYRHLKNIMSLRHPDGASNPNLQEVGAGAGTGIANGRNSKLTDGNKNDVRSTASADDDDDDDDNSAVPLPPTSKLLTLSREGFDGGALFAEHCDRLGTGLGRFRNEFHPTEHVLPNRRGIYSKASVKKLNTYRMELQNQK